MHARDVFVSYFAFFLPRPSLSSLLARVLPPETDTPARRTPLHPFLLFRKMTPPR
jgi:hypothetical protein